MKSIVLVQGPRDAGPGEREQMLAKADEVLRSLDAADHIRIDVPSTGGSDDGDGALRAPVQQIVPALQSGSLFGGRSGILVVDADNLLKAECEVISELLGTVDPDQVAAAFVASGTIKAPLGAKLKKVGDVVTIAKLRERDASEWLAAAARDRGVKLVGDAAEALIHTFGTDVGSMARALDQLILEGGEITGDMVRTRYRNRPDEPVWHLADAIVAGDQGEALRRLADFLQHGHPLQFTAFLENELRRQAMAAAAPDIETFAEWIGASPDAFPTKKAWRRRSQTKASDLRLAVDALARADLQLKAAPEATHRVTLERLTVALCRWYGGGRTARAGR